MAMPPYSSGTSIPNRPIAFISSTISSGYRPASSHARATGLMLLRAKSRIRSRKAACCSESSKSIALRLRRFRARALAAEVYEGGAPERDHLGSTLVEAGRAHGDDADVGARARLADLQHLGARVDGIAFKHRVRQPHLVPTEVGHHVLRHIADALPRHQRERQAAVDQRFPELRL